MSDVLQLVEWICVAGASDAHSLLKQKAIEMLDSSPEDIRAPSVIAAEAAEAAATSAAGGNDSSSSSSSSSTPPTPIAAAPPKPKMHRCATCELPVAARYEAPEPALAQYHLVLQHVDTVYLPQTGPVCGAASIAGTVLSLLRHAGHTQAAIKEEVTVRAVQDVYHSLGVPNVYETTAAVGNLTIKKACMALRIPSLPSVQLIVSDFGALLERDPKIKAMVEWEKLKKGMAAGSRFLYHSRNHYNRIFGWRELWSHGRAAGQDESGEKQQGEEAAAAAAVFGRTSRNVNVEESSLVSSLKAGNGVGDKEAVLDLENLAPPPPPPSIRSRGGADRPVRALDARKRMLLAKAAASTSVAGPARVVEPDYSGCVARRQVLMAKKGQRPQHWVDWEAVCADIATHNRHHMIFEIKLVDRSAK